MMEEARLKQLVSKFIAEKLSEAEKVEFFREAEEHPEIWDLVRKLQDTDALIADLSDHHHQTTTEDRKDNRDVYWLVAVVTLIIVAGVLCNRSRVRHNSFRTAVIQFKK